MPVKSYYVLFKMIARKQTKQLIPGTDTSIMERLTLINEFDPISSFRLGQGILKGEVSLYH